MSSCPGSTLEAFLMWQHDLVVDGDGSANPSLEIAEAMGRSSTRTHLTALEFAGIVELYEGHREGIEAKLAQFDEATMSWRDYAWFAFDDTSLIDEAARHLIQQAEQAKKEASDR